MSLIPAIEEIAERREVDNKLTGHLAPPADAAQAAQQNVKNAARSTGSMQSAGQNAGGRDPFLEGWGE